MRKIKIPQAIDASWEDAFNVANNDQNRLLLMNKIMRKKSFFSTIDQRAIGVVYDTEHERYVNYVPQYFQREMMHSFLYMKHMN